MSKYDWDKIISELPENGGPYFSYPGDDGSDDENTWLEKANDYAEWVTERAWQAARKSMEEDRRKEREQRREELPGEVIAGCFIFMIVIYVSSLFI